MSVQLARRHFTVDDFARMVEAGILTEDDRVELIDGEILEMSPIGSAHAACVKLLNSILSQRSSGRYIVSVQDPIVLTNSTEPEPDIALLRHRRDYYAKALPRARDTYLVIEVADSSVDYDRDVKIPLYATSGIKEAWLVDLNSDLVEVYDRARGGIYQRCRRFGRGEVVESRFVGQPSLNINDLLP
jgi:Uma2 family endonuclease